MKTYYSVIEDFLSKDIIITKSTELNLDDFLEHEISSVSQVRCLILHYILDKPILENMIYRKIYTYEMIKMSSLERNYNVETINCVVLNS